MRDSGNEVDFLMGTPIHFILEFPQGIFASKCILIGRLPEPISEGWEGQKEWSEVE